MKKIIFIFLLAFSHYAQEFSMRFIKTDAEKFPMVYSVVQVYDSFNEPITTLNQNNFAVSVDGKQCDSVKSITYKESGIGLNILLSIDLSGSMSGQPLKLIKNAVIKFIDEMRTVDKLAIIGFANDAELIADFSNDKSFLRKKINELSILGNQTAMYYGIYKGIAKLRDFDNKGGKIAIVLGDGKNSTTASSYTEDDVIELAKENGIPVFSISYTKVDPIHLQSLERISEKTGGNFYNSPTSEELSKQYEKLYRQILNTYIISYLVPDIPGDGNEHINIITCTYKENKKTISNKFIAPAGVQAYKKQTVIVSKPIPHWYYYAGGAIIVT